LVAPRFPPTYARRVVALHSIPKSPKSICVNCPCAGRER
jgi:hypothetical protein